MSNWEVKKDTEKVKALRAHILEECKRQSFTRHEFSQLLCKFGGKSRRDAIGQPKNTKNLTQSASAVKSILKSPKVSMPTTD